MLTIRLDLPSAGAARLRLSGHLDGSAARDVLHAAADVVRCGCSRLVVDLDGVTSWDSDAAFAVVGCARLSRWVEGGVDVVGASPAARELASQAGVEASASDRDTDAVQRLAVAACPSPACAPDTMAACHAC